MLITKCESYTATIYVAGEMHRIKDICADFCTKGFCVSIQETEYIYTGGQQKGASVTIINYPRFPRSKEDIQREAGQLATRLIEEGYQESCTIVYPDESVYISKRAEDL